MFATPESSPPSGPMVNQVRLPRCLRSAASPVVTLALEPLHEEQPTPFAEEGGENGEEDVEVEEATRLLNTESCDSLGETFFDANS